MKSPKITLLIITFLFTAFFSCKTAEEQKITLSKGNIKYDYHKDNIGQIYFMDKLIPSSKVEPIDNLNEIILSEGNEFFIRLLPEFSQTHYLSMLLPNISANELCKFGNWSVKFYVNDEFVYEDNIHPGAGLCSQRNQFSEVIVPLIANKDKLDNHWGEHPPISRTGFVLN